MAGKASKEGLVAMAVTRLKEMILAREPGSQIGSLPDLANQIGVGVVTVRQAARLLEHEGFLKVRRGNNGGFYGARPGPETLGPAVASFLHLHQSHEREAIEIMTLLDCDLVAAAAASTDEAQRNRLRHLGERIDECDTAEQRASFVQELHDILFKMVDRPLLEMMVRISMQHYLARTGLPIYEGAAGAERWKQERHAIFYAILRRDPDLARFEAQRRRDYVLQRVGSVDRDAA